MISRRKFLGGLVAFYAALTDAQPATGAGRPVRVGLLITGARDTAAGGTVFVNAMRELGWTEGHNIIYDRVYFEPGRLRALAAELVARKPDLIHVTSNGAALAVLANTRSIPIVFGAIANPVEIGLVQSVRRPGGIATGIANIGWELGGRRMQLLKEVLPKISRVGVLAIDNPGSGSPAEWKLIEQTARPDVDVLGVVVKGPGELDGALTLLAERRIEAVFTTHVVLFMRERRRILEFAARHRIPVIGHRSEMADDGAFMSYSSILSEQIRRAAQLADKVLKGTKPADIPVERPTKFELVINMKTAKALGITIPRSVLAQADRIIE